jgi:hypothetical protein
MAGGGGTISFTAYQCDPPDMTPAQAAAIVRGRTGAFFIFQGALNPPPPYLTTFVVTRATCDYLEGLGWTKTKFTWPPPME